MSANNWTVCPKCLKKSRDAVARAEKRLEESYGKVSREKYKEMESNVAEMQRACHAPNKTMREDWEINMDGDGELMVRYSALCNRCDFQHTFKHDETVSIN